MTAAMGLRDAIRAALDAAVGTATRLGASERQHSADPGITARAASDRRVLNKHDPMYQDGGGPYCNHCEASTDWPCFDVWEVAIRHAVPLPSGGMTDLECAACGSTETGWNAEQGGFCLGCGRSDSDDD